MTKRKGTNNNLPHYAQKTKDWATRTQLKQGVKPCAQEE